MCFQMFSYFPTCFRSFPNVFFHLQMFSFFQNVFFPKCLLSFPNVFFLFQMFSLFLKCFLFLFYVSLSLTHECFLFLAALLFLIDRWRSDECLVKRRLWIDAQRGHTQGSRTVTIIILDMNC